MTTSQPQPQIPSEDGHASSNEAAEAIVGLSAKERATLRKLARSYWKDRTHAPNAACDPDDLLQEALVRTLQGTRRWRRSVAILKHLVRTMESISWDALRARKVQPHSWAEHRVQEIHRCFSFGASLLMKTRPRVVSPEFFFQGSHNSQTCAF